MMKIIYGINGKQYISLNRFINLKTNQLDEMKNLIKEIERLTELNKAYKLILNKGANNG